eukprot:TRINITY_DN13972_c0_g1_i2.p1 TRINITY_DN13972_c0_g1~~TRINITY_DN13972_c0_g1_i2.p1  ORF type:complete len:180 (-),score=24.91 TRINITY_DN13972_c0_g1_i2:48-587(-)
MSRKPERPSKTPVAPHMLAEQWKSRVNKEDVAYYHGREIRQKATAEKINEFCQRGAFRPDSQSSRPQTGVSSVYFDAPPSTAGSRSSARSRATVTSVSSSRFGEQQDRIDDLETRLDSERVARLAAERELQRLQQEGSRSNTRQSRDQESRCSQASGVSSRCASQMTTGSGFSKQRSRR